MSDSVLVAEDVALIVRKYPCSIRTSLVMAPENKCNELDNDVQEIAPREGSSDMEPTI